VAAFLEKRKMEKTPNFSKFAILKINFR